MAKVVWQGFVLSPTNGKPVSGAEIRVFDADSGLATTLYSDRAGSAGPGNPFFTGPDGFVQFYVDPKRIRVEAYEGSQVAQFDDVLVGTVDDGGIVTANLADGAVTRQKLNFNPVEYVDDVAEMLALSSPVEGQRVSVTEYMTDIAGGHAEYYWDSTRLKSAHNGSSVISNTVPWDGSASGLNDFQDGVGETDPSGTGCWVSLIEMEKASAWGISPDNPDNLDALLNFIESSQYPDNLGDPVCPPLIFDHGTYNFSGTIQLKAKVGFYGQTKEKDNGVAGTVFQFPSGSGDGIIIHSFNTINNGAIESPATSGADGSVIDGISIIGPGSGTRAAIYDYDLSKMLMVYRGTISGSDFDAYAINNPNYSSSPVAQFSVTGSGLACTPLPISGPLGTFQEGEVITGGTSGVTATVRFASTRYTVLMISGGSGTFTAGETITGGVSGATAFVYQAQAGTGFFYISLSSASGPLITGNGVSLAKSQGEYGSGVVMFAAATIRNCRIEGWKEHGIKIATSGTGYTSGNANRFAIRDVWINGVGGHGVIVSGGDSNAGYGLGINATSCGGFSINDESFLGNTWEACHSSLNQIGAYKSDGNTDRSTLFIDCYSEGGQPRLPYPSYASPIHGASMSIGGTQGAPVIESIDWSDQINGYVNFQPRKGIKYRGLDYGEIGSSLSGTRLLITSSSAGLANALVSANQGNYGNGRGAGVAFRHPHENNSSLECASVSGVATTSGAEIRFNLREGNQRGQYATIAGGTGAAIEITVSGGVITAAEVLRRGSGYSSTDTITIAGPAGGTGADLRPVVADGRLIAVDIINGGSGYTDTAPQERWAVRWGNAGPSNDNAMSAGTASERYSDCYAVNMRPGDGTPIWTSGTGTPEGAVTAPVGSLFTRTDGGASTTLYVKESGAGNTGWVAK